ncbi:hypothetical protein G6F31_021952 [Rhizopus arrhizus]|nr:hypothetical protein G6F31_021952 [Rhizopus arrhizus]
MPRLAGRRAAEWLLQGKAFSAADAHEAGLATSVAPKGQALAAAQATAAALARRAPKPPPPTLDSTGNTT